MFDLKSLALCLGEVLVVTDGLNQQPNVAAEKRFEFCRSGPGILNGVVEHGGNQNGQILHLADINEDIGYFQGMVDIG